METSIVKKICIIVTQIQNANADIYFLICYITTKILYLFQQNILFLIVLK